MGAHDDAERVHAETSAAWAAWLQANHTRDGGVWLVSWRRHTQRPSVAYEDAVTEALRFGWIDSTARRLDDERTMQRYSPRRPGSGWSASNKDRIARLEVEDRLEPAGRAVLEAARADGSWNLLDSVEALEVPDDLASALDALPGAREQWDGFPPSARKQILHWIVLAKRPETRRRRVAEAAEKAVHGERANQ